MRKKTAPSPSHYSLPRLLGPLAILSLVCAQPATRTSPCIWDDTYRSAVAAARPIPTSRGGRESHDRLRRLADMLQGRTERVVLRQRARRIRPLSGQVRLEAMTPNEEAYQAVWLIWTGRAGRALTYQNGRIRERELTEHEWKDSIAPIGRAPLHSWLNPAADDGPAFFLSFSVNGQCGQVALYAPVFSNVMPEEYRSLDEKSRREKSVVKRLLQLAEPAADSDADDDAR